MAVAAEELGTIETRIPARLDRLPWSRFHWLIVVGLGTSWILDGLEVTMVGSVAARMTSHGSGIDISTAQIGIAGSIYVVGACLGALFFGQMCDKYGRKKLFMITLSIYIASTVLTAFSFAPWFFFLARFLTGAGIGGEYSAINSAIDELIPARARGRVDLIINGSYWLGSIAGAGAALFFLSDIFSNFLGWRLAFGVGAVLGLAVLLVRRNIPESPRWLFIHGREEEAEAIVDGIEEDVEAQTGQDLSHPDKSITVRQRTVIKFREIARVAFKTYPKRSILCVALFVGQAFLYNGLTFNLGSLMTTFFGVSAALVPIFFIIYGAGNFTGPLILGRLFDTIGRKPMISGTYLGSALLSVVLAWLFFAGMLNAVTFIIVLVAVFFLASAGASAAYLTTSEIFPMETRALAIAFFYAIGTAVGGIAGPLLFGKLIGTGEKGPVAIAFLIGAAVMALGGVAELFFGVKAEGQQLEDIAKPLTVEDAEGGDAGDSGDGRGTGQGPDRSAASRERAEAAEQRARAAEHRASAHDHLARAADGSGDADAARERAETEQVMAQIADLLAQAHDERAAAQDELADADAADEPHLELAAREQARAAEERARAHEADAAVLSADCDADSDRNRSLADAALERARSREQKAQAAKLRGPEETSGPSEEGPEASEESSEGAASAEVRAARAEMHETWATMHRELARVHESHADGDAAGEAEANRAAEVAAEQAQAAQDRVDAAERRSDARDERQEASAEEEAGQRREQDAARREAERRARERIARRRQYEHSGMRRFRPGPGRISGSPGMGVTTPAQAPDLDNEVQTIARALGEHGATERHELARMVGARYWGPGVFRAALRDAVAEGAARHTSHSIYAPADHDGRGAGGRGNGDNDGSPGGS